MGDIHNHKHSSTNGLSVAFWMNAIFSVIELVGGILTNSTAIVADAFHDFMDAVAIGIAIVLEKVSGKKRSKNYSYGYKRFSLLSAVLLSVLLLVGAVLMIVKAIQSFMVSETVNSVGMLWLSLLGIGINGFAFLKIKKSHSVKHDDHHPVISENHNSKAIMLHLLEDVLGWVAVLFGAVVMYFTNWYWIDSVLAIGIALFIIYNAFNNLLSTMKIFLQSVPKQVNTNIIAKEINDIDGVLGFHDLHIWTLDGNINIGSVHVIIQDIDKAGRSLVMTAINQIMNRNHIHHPTIQLETVEDQCNLLEC